MRKFHCLAILTPVALIATVQMCDAAGLKPASAEISVLEDGDRAKVDVQESKQALRQRELEKMMNSENEATCGSVNIGNNNGSQTGSSRVAPHDTTVIVTGDVFNTATCGR